MKLAFTLLLSLWSIFALAQDAAIRQIATEYLKNQSANWDLQPIAIDQLIITDYHQTKSTGAHHLYFTQTYQGIPIQGAMINLTIDQQENVHHVGHRLESELAEKVNTTIPVLSAEAALQTAIDLLDLSTENLPRLLSQENQKTFRYAGDQLSEEPITIKLCFFRTKDQGIRLSWDLAIRQLDRSDFPSLRIDALTGKLLEQTSFTYHCEFPVDHNHSNISSSLNIAGTETHIESAGTYRIFPLPVESPAHGDRSLISDPENALASPFGWHDTNATPGPEYTITRGNNAHAYQDSNGNNLSSNDEPNGGTGLSFDYPYNTDNTPQQNQNAAVTNLFYATNFIHDVAYRYGFDEAAGNFQQNNYGNGGFEGDYVKAEAMDGDGFNNARFSASGDGSIGRLEMFLWDRNAGGQRVVNVTAPEIAAGLYNAGLADYGQPISNTPITGEVVEVNDGVYNPLTSDGCESNFVNGADLNGKIAIVDRGGCDFELKTSYAENYGAIAVIICDYNPEPAPVLGVPGIPNPSIPTVRIGSVDCQKIRVYAGQGLTISLELPAPTGPEFINGSVDNGTIIHEYTHGISNRLTGGANTSLCLNNNEQMGEGWSDFFALALTSKSSDTGPQPRGISTFLQRETNDGKGIRNFPYSTDLNINPYTYKDIGNERIPHGLGAVWCAMLWDFHWAMIDQHGFSADAYNGDLGNNRAIQLIVDGMKMQPCDPGFVDARDAILQADQIRYGGANQTLIWQAFAKRGLGFSADQGSNNGVDAFEAYDLPPLLVKELKIKKRSSDLINAGETFNFFIDVYNHKETTLTDVVVTDQIPEGLTWTGLSNPPNATLNGNEIQFNLGNMAYLDTVTIAYQVESATDKYSIQKAYFPAEESSEGVVVPIQPVDNSALFWQLSTNQPNTGSRSWYINNTSAEARQHLILSNRFNISGTRPALRFYHNYKTEPGIDGGIVEVTRSEEPVDAPFDLLSDKMIRNGYPGFVQYTTFIIPELEAFTGTSGGYIPTYVDLSNYNNDQVYFRFNFASSSGGIPPGGGHWYVDDIEVLDLFSYNGEACVSASEGDQACTIIPEGGVIVESQLGVATNNLDQLNWHYKIYPNPADDQVNIEVDLPTASKLQISVVSIGGQTVSSRQVQAGAGLSVVALDIANVAAGFYFVKIETRAGFAVRKLILR